MKHTPETLERIFSRFLPEPNSGCWIWTEGVTEAGYAKISVDGVEVYVHRVMYEHFVKPIPPKFEIDHLCRVRCCVYPRHLEAVTHQENGRRGIAGKLGRERQQAKTHCPAGHTYDETNTYKRPDGGRDCKACAKERAARYKRKAG